MQNTIRLRRWCAAAAALLLTHAVLPTAAAAAQTQPAEQPMIALTFDDGPSQANTTRILDVLEVNGAKATFFVIGSLLAENADVTRRAKEMGCEIGNHTFGHKSWVDLSEQEICRQIAQADAVIERELGVKAALLRVPGGRCCGHASLAARPIILWSVDTEDWRYATEKGGNTAANRRAVIREATEHIRDGDIILMHDIYALTAQCCETIVPNLRAQGFRLVTVSELMRRREIEMHGGEVYFSAR